MRAIKSLSRLGAGEGAFDYEMHAAKRITYVGVTFRSRSEEEKHTVSRLAYAALGPDLAAGRYHLAIDRAFRLEEIDEAHAHMRANNHFGKIAVTI